MNKRFVYAIAGFLVGFLLAFLLWGLAKPTEASYTGRPPSAETSIECGEITMSFHNPTPWLFVFDYRVDGEAVVSQSPWAGLQFNSSSPLYPQYFGDRWHLVPVANNNNQDIVLNFGEDTGIHQVEYRLAEGAEQDMYFDWTSVRVQSDCEEPVPTVLVCLDGENELTIPRTQEAWDRVLYSWHDAYVGGCEVPEPTPIPTPVVFEPGVAGGGGFTPVCYGRSHPIIPWASATRTDGTNASINYVPTAGEGEPVNVVYSENPFEIIFNLGNHGLRDWTPNNGNVQLHDLIAGQSYWYRMANGCSPWSGIFFLPR
jgi:hypothetical protein